MRSVIARCGVSVLVSAVGFALWSLGGAPPASLWQALWAFAVLLALSLCLTLLPAARERHRQEDGRPQDLDHKMLAQLGYGICEVDAAGNVRSLNRVAEHALGYTLRDVQGHNFHQAFHECGAVSSCSLASALATGTNGRLQEGIVRRQDGSPLAISYIAAPLFHKGQIDGVVLAFHDASEQHRTLTALREGTALYREIVLASPDPVVVTDMYGYVMLANARAAAMLGYSSETTLLDANALDFVAPGDRPRAIRDKERALGGEEIEKVEYLWACADGSFCPVEVSMKVIRDENGAPRALVQLARDLRELKRVEAAIRAGEARLAMQDEIARVLTESTRLERALPSLLQTLCCRGGWEVGSFWRTEPAGQTLQCQELWHAGGRSLARFERATRDEPILARTDPLWQAWEGKVPVWLADVREAAPSARLVSAIQDGLYATLCVPVQGADRLGGVLELCSSSVRPPDQELTRAILAAATQLGQFIERKEAEAALEYQALHDSLTGLANRTLFHDRLQQAILRAERYAWPVTLLLMDLDGFKEINDTLGHQAGDELLQQLATRLQRLFRHSDTIARMGGDEFALILPGTGESGAVEAADKILGELCTPFRVEGLTVDIGTSIGIAQYPQDGNDAHTLLRCADVAMYGAKRSGCGYLQSGESVPDDQDSPSRLAL